VTLKIYTKTGDDGTTSLFRGGRVSKDNLRIEAYGTVDELNAALGIASSEITEKEILEVLKKIQNDLFTIGSDLATPEETEFQKIKNLSRTDSSLISDLEQIIDKFDKRLLVLTNFILPGGTKGAAYLHSARTICRKAERRVVSLSLSSEINMNILIYLNRLSDLLFVLSRYENLVNNTPDIEWIK